MTLLAGPAPVESEQQAVVPWLQGGDIAGEIASQKLTDECSGGFFLSDKVAGTVASRWSGRVTSEGCWGGHPRGRVLQAGETANAKALRQERQSGQCGWSRVSKEGGGKSGGRWALRITPLQAGWESQSAVSRGGLYPNSGAHSDLWPLWGGQWRGQWGCEPEKQCGGSGSGPRGQ